MPLLPPILLLSIMVLVPLADNSSYIFCRMVNAMEPETCELITFEEDQLPEESDDCIVFVESEGASQCQQRDVCSLFELPGPSLWYPTVPVETVVIKAGDDYYKFNSPGSDDGCFDVTIEDGLVEWEKIGSRPSCKDISHVQAWETLVCEE